jgi:hypothetical protein
MRSLKQIQKPVIQHQFNQLNEVDYPYINIQTFGIL